jgi:hypothetical protein
MAQCHWYGEFRSHGWIHLCFKAYLYCMMFHLWVQFHPCWIFSMLHEFHPFEDFVHVISFIKLEKIIQMWISSLSFNIWYHPNLKLMKMHCLIIQPWYTIAYEFNICSLGQLHTTNLLFPLFVFCAFHNCWGLSFKYFKTNKGFYVEEKYEDFHFIS